MSIWGPVVAASIAAFFGALGLIVNKENKTSEFRQQWITDLRASMIAFSAKLAINNAIKASNGNHNHSDFEEIMRLEGNIKLQINILKPSKEEVNLLNIIKKLKGTIGGQIPDFQDSLDDFYLASAKVLKKEWRRVKAGEVKYRICLILCFTMSLIVLASLLTYIYFHYQHIEEMIIK